MLVLTVDTSCPSASIGLVSDGATLAAAWNHEQSLHAERLGGMARRVLRDANRTVEQLDLLAVGMGPGSFTGVRVGMAWAKGLALSASIPVVGVLSLDAMGWLARQQVGAVFTMPVLDARKGELFIGCLDPSGRIVRRPDHVRRSAVNAWMESLPVDVGRLWLVGQHFDEIAFSQARWLVEPRYHVPSPEAMAALASDKWQQAQRDELDFLEPLYVRPPDITMPRNSSSRAVSS